jgi:hypothetical protein
MRPILDIVIKSGQTAIFNLERIEILINKILHNIKIRSEECGQIVTTVF